MEAPTVEIAEKQKSEIFQCKICPYNTLRQPYLDKHMQQKHGFAKVIPEGSTPPGKKRKCKVGKDTNIAKKLSKNSADTKDNALAESDKVAEKEVYQCTQCDFKTTEVEELHSHESTHKTLELYKCSDCDYASRNKRNMRTHIKIHVDRSNMEKFECKFCDKFSTTNKNSLYKHVSVKHKDTMKMFECDACSYATPYKAHLASHQKTHMDPAELPTYHCEICDFETRYAGTIQRHVNKHKERNETADAELIVKEIDGVSQTVWFCCDLCEFRTKDQRYVILHKKVHARADEINRKGEEIVFGKPEGSSSSSSSNNEDTVTSNNKEVDTVTENSS